MSIGKIAKWSLYFMLAVTVVVLGLYYGGGYTDPNAEVLEPINTEILMFWAYALVGIGIVCTAFFALFQFGVSLKDTPKKALETVVNIALFAAVLGVTYAIADGTVLDLPGYDGEDNVPGTLKIADMMLYSSYFLIGFAVVSISLSNVLKLVKK
ncbi:MAG: hypothetical protein ACRC6R_03460 [Bacteroidales bacterium]